MPNLDEPTQPGEPTLSTANGRPCWRTRWQGRYSKKLGRRPRYTKRWYCDEGFSDRNTVLIVYGKWLNDWENDLGIQDPYFLTSTPTVASLCVAYLEHAKKFYTKNDKKTSSVLRIVSALQLLIEQPLKDSDPRIQKPTKTNPGVVAMGDLPQDQFTPPDLLRYRDSLVLGKDEKARRRKTCNEYMSIVRQCYRWGVQQGMFKADVWMALGAVEYIKKGRSSAKEGRKIKSVSREVVDATLVELRPLVGAIVEVVWWTPMRIHEACIIRPCRMDTSNDVWLYQPDTHKLDHLEGDEFEERIIPIGPRAQKVLAPFMGGDPHQYIFQPTDKHGVSRDTHGAYYETGALRRAIHRACDRAFPPPDHLIRKTIPGARNKKTTLTPEQEEELRAWQKAHRWNPNQLRHAVATRYERKYGIETASEMMDHQSEDVTRIYVDEDLKRIMEIAKENG